MRQPTLYQRHRIKQTVSETAVAAADACDVPSRHASNGTRFGSAVLLAAVTASALFSVAGAATSRGSLMVIQLGDGSSAPTPGTALPVYLAELRAADGSWLSFNLVNATGSAAGGGSIRAAPNAPTDCTLPAPGASGTTWLYDADGLPAGNRDLTASFVCYQTPPGGPSDMGATKVIGNVGSDLSSQIAFSVTSHTNVAPVGTDPAVGPVISGFRQAVSVDAVTSVAYTVVGNAAALNGVRVWAGGAATSTTAVSGSTDAGEPGYSSAVSLSVTTGSTVYFLVQDVPETVSGLPGFSSAVYSYSPPSTAATLYVLLPQATIPSAWALAWNKAGAFFYVSFTLNPTAQGCIAKFTKAPYGSGVSV